jgi:formamidopyrimidine-DNA glycosylase
MPELPDVELFKRYLDANALHRAIAEVTVLDTRILHAISAGDFHSTLTGACLVDTRRHGKHLLARLGDGEWLAFHFGMTGGLQCFDAAKRAPRYSRVVFTFADGGRLAYTSMRMLGKVGVVEDADVFLIEEELGPDALDDALSPAGFSERLGKGRRGVKAALMDQTVIAGIGNVYSDEILFQARLHPSTPVSKLDDRARRALFDASRRVLETAIRLGAGSEQFLERLLDDYLLPHRVKDGVCPRCGGAIHMLKASGRTAYFCPACQPAAD